MARSTETAGSWILDDRPRHPARRPAARPLVRAPGYAETFEASALPASGGAPGSSLTRPLAATITMAAPVAGRGRPVTEGS
jgi:hypothetical protein